MSLPDIQQIQSLLKEHHVRLAYTLEFPLYRELPDEVKLALSILQKHGMKIVITLEPEKEDAVEKT